MNINYLSLFPDFEGAARHCNMALHEQHRNGLKRILADLPHFFDALFD